MTSSQDPRVNPASPLHPLRLEAIDHAFRRAVLAHSDRRALVHDSATWTYGQLDLLSSRLAAKLWDQGIGPGDVVAIVTDRNPAFVCAILAVLRTGAAFAMIDDAYPEARVRTCIQVAKARHVILVGSAHRFYAHALGARPMTKLPRDLGEMTALLGDCAEIAPREVSATDIAYLTFTSGSTGAPKCVVTGHAPLPHFIAWHVRTFGLEAEDHFSLLSGVSHDPLLRDIFTPLSIGATLHVPDQRLLTDPSDLFRWISTDAITVCHLTPALGQVIQAGARGQLLPRLRFFFWGGDILKPALVAELRAIATKARHVNFYGTTETPQAVGFFCIDDLSPRERPIPVGKGISDVQLLVLDETGRLVADGTVGELGVRTRYLSRGYLGDDVATANRYVVNPYTGDPGDRIYRTGDRAVFLADGSVEFRGRGDDQVKIRGYRVELGEIASVIQKNPSVHDAVVLARARTSGDAQIVAYVTAKAGCTLTGASMAESLRVELPQYMQPSAYLVLDEFPLLPNRKVDRRALLEMPLGVNVPAVLEPAGSARERELATLWSEVLGVPSVGVHESFYDLGGDSLTAIRVMIRMETMGLDEAMCRWILQGASVRVIAQAAEGIHATLLPAIDADSRARLLLNVLRGAMITLMLGSHWTGGIFARPSMRTIAAALNPVLNWPTPGFAIAFGMTLGFVHYPVYRANPSREWALLRRGAVLVGAGAILASANSALLNVLSPANYWPPLDNALAYYLLALVTAPLWFRIIGSPRFATVRALGFAAALLAVHHMLRPGPMTETQWRYWGPLLGKYGYFNLSGGALSGIAIGMALKKYKRVPSWYPVLGLALMIIGAVTSGREGGRSALLAESSDVELWKWAFYGGLLLITMTLIHRLLARVVGSGGAAETGAKVLGVAGQLAFPLFIVDFLARDVGKLVESFTAGSKWLHYVVNLVLLVAGLTYLLRRMYRLYYGADPTITRQPRLADGEAV